MSKWTSVDRVDRVASWQVVVVAAVVGPSKTWLPNEILRLATYEPATGVISRRLALDDLL